MGAAVFLLVWSVYHGDMRITKNNSTMENLQNMYNFNNTPLSQTFGDFS
jgi:hypothetical protein